MSEHPSEEIIQEFRLVFSLLGRLRAHNPDPSRREKAVYKRRRISEHSAITNGRLKKSKLMAGFQVPRAFGNSLVYKEQHGWVVKVILSAVEEKTKIRQENNLIHFPGFSGKGVVV